MKSDSTTTVHDPNVTLVRGNGDDDHNGDGDEHIIQEQPPSKLSKFLSLFLNRKMLLVLTLGLSFCTVFTAFNTTQGFITTLKKKLGFQSLAILYAFFAVSNFISPVIVDRIGPKLALLFGAVPYSLFVLASCFSSAPLLLTCAALLGIGASILWTAHGQFLTEISGSEMGFFSGIFFGIFQLSNIVGNLLTGALLKMGVSIFWTFFILFCISVIGVCMLLLLLLDYIKPLSSSSSVNIEQQQEEEEEEDVQQEQQQQPQEQQPVEVEEEQERITIINSQQRKKRKKNKANNKKKKSKSIARRMRSTLDVLLDVRMLFFLPISLYSGYSISVFTGVLPPIIRDQAGVEMISWVATCFGLAEAIGSITFGKLIDKLGRRGMMFVTLFLHIIAVALCWTMLLGGVPLYFVTLFFCGAADSGLNTSIYSILGSPSYFKRRASDAFAGFKMVQSIASACGFLSSTYATTEVIKIILSVLCGMAIVAFVLLEFFIAPSDQPESIAETPSEETS